MPDATVTMLGQLEANHARGPAWEADIPCSELPAHPKVKVIAFYLPQFHPIPENDAWWGRGFTEWTNVTKALPRFVGHVQPRLPADLGFYDLRNPDTLHRQADLARRYGIGGFCFHHYWFNGHRLLDTPLDLLLADPSIDLPFCVNWANENWTRRWDGQEQDILLAQHYSPEDDLAFARHLIPIVRDPRYIQVDGRPLVMLYRPGILPDPLATMRRWRAEFTRAGLPNPFVVMAQGFGDEDPRPHGMDAAAEFPPHKMRDLHSVNHTLDLLDPGFSGHVVNYADVAAGFADMPRPEFPLFRAVSPSWDNEARKPGRGFTMAGATPALYGSWLNAACRAAITEATHDDERIVFVNAWNEWAEGAMLEPDRHFGHAYLAETARVLAALDRPQSVPSPAAPSVAALPRYDDGLHHLALISHDARFHGAQVLALALARALVLNHNVDLTILIGGPGDLTEDFATIARTETIPGEFADQAAWAAAARALAARGVTAVLCNTTVAARAIGPLRDAGLRIVLLVHELPSLIRSYRLESAAQDAAQHAAAIVFPSAWVRDRFVEVAGPIHGRTAIHHQGLHLVRTPPDERLAKRRLLRRQHGIADDRRIVIGVGYGDTRKGLDLWAALIPRVVKAVPDTLFVWIGLTEATLRNWLLHDLASVGMSDHLLLVGATSDLSPWYSAADLFALTSREDPFPSVVVEAMAYGLPVVLFEESGGTVDLVRDAGGATVPYLDVAAMAAAIAHLLTDPAEAAAMGRALEARTHSGFDYADYARALIELAAPPTATVSAVVPNFNYARHLRQRLESIWSQSLPPVEIIVLDDASTDDSIAVIETLARESPIPLRLVRNETNSGSVSSQWARGVGLATGDLVWIAEADDVADPGFLAALVPVFENPAVVLGHTDSRMIDEAGAVLAPDYRGYVADVNPTRWTADFHLAGDEAVAEAFAVKNSLPNVSAAVFRRTALQAVLEAHVDEMIAFRNAGDWLCYIRLLAQGGTFAFISQSLNGHRRHQHSVTIAGNDRRHFEEILKMQDFAAELVQVPPAIRVIALEYRKTVAKHFGFGLEDVG